MKRLDTKTKQLIQMSKDIKHSMIMGEIPRITKIIDLLDSVIELEHKNGVPFVQA